MTTLSVQDHNWRVFRECHKADHADVFFPEKGNQAHRAKKVCQECPVQQQCLQEALERDEPFGIWGGFTPPERLRIKRGQPVAGATVRERRERKPRKPTTFSDVVRRDETGHGYQRYRKGCRCGTCRAGNAAMQRAYQQRGEMPPRSCAVCAKEVTGRGRHRFCSTECRQTSQRTRVRRSAA